MSAAKLNTIDTQIDHQRIVTLTRDACVAAAQSHGKFLSASTDEKLMSAGPVHGQWMSLVMLTSADLRLSLKIFYSLEQAQTFAAAALDLPIDKLKPSSVSFFMREFIILVAETLSESIKKQNNVVLGISLPIVTRGFDEVFSTLPPYGMQFESKWTFITGVGNFCCYLMMQGTLK